MANPKKICTLLSVSLMNQTTIMLGKPWNPKQFCKENWVLIFLREIIFLFQETNFVCCDARNCRSPVRNEKPPSALQALPI